MDRDDFTDASLTFPHSFKLSSSRNVDGSIQQLGETERALVTSDVFSQLTDGLIPQVSSLPTLSWPPRTVRQSWATTSPQPRPSPAWR